MVDVAHHHDPAPAEAPAEAHHQAHNHALTYPLRVELTLGVRGLATFTHLDLRTSRT
tara:strand:+ start:219 stop:389 length:171 start_codon:yes stop_codon:yes gene_type:complete